MSKWTENNVVLVSAALFRQIKFRYDRLGIQGKLHVEDYFEYFRITDKKRYMSKELAETLG